MALGGPQFVENTSGGGFDTSGAYNYIQALLVYLNQNFAKQGSSDPFAPASGVIPQQDGQLDADSSVTPFTIVNGSIYNNYSFAVARVRLKGIAGTTSAIPDTNNKMSTTFRNPASSRWP